MGYFNYNNKRIYYNESGAGRPLVLLHGNTASSNMFAEIAGKYEKDFNVILIDFLGHGQSDRLEEFPADLWYEEARQVIALLEEKQYSEVNLIGSSGGALTAINVALEAPRLVHKVIADSFEGEKALKEIVEYIQIDREHSKQDQDSVLFYSYMHGSDWEQVVNNDTSAIVRHGREIGRFFHKDLQELKTDILLTGSKEDEFVRALSPTYFQDVYGEMISKTGHGSIHIFDTGRHPAMLSNPDEFYRISMEFFNR